MRYRLVVTDLDGTARSRRHGITQGVKDAVRAARARGIRVCVATGRMWRTAAPWVAALGADSPAILYNGGQIYDFEASRTLYARRLPAATARAALALAGQAQDIQPHLYVGEGVYAGRRHPLSDAFVADEGYGYEVVPDLGDLLAGGPAGDPWKILIIGDPPRMEALEAEVRGSGLPVHAVRSEPTYLEILPPGVSKGTALEVLLAHLGLAASQVVAVGDNWNDLEMIEAAGLGVAMGHAPPEVRRRADLVVSSADDEGLREVLERHLA